MKRAIIIMACAAAALTGCQPADESGTMTEPSGAERSGDTNGSGSGQSGGQGTQSTNNPGGAGTPGNP